MSWNEFTNSHEENLLAKSIHRSEVKYPPELEGILFVLYTCDKI